MTKRLTALLLSAVLAASGAYAGQESTDQTGAGRLQSPGPTSDGVEEAEPQDAVDVRDDSAETASERRDVQVDKFNVRQEFGPTQGSRTRWMAPEAISEKRAAVATAPQGGENAGQNRAGDDSGKTDKSDAARARKKRVEPCPLPAGGSDPASTAAGASAANPGCGNP